MSRYIFLISYNIATINRVAYKQWKFISHSSGGGNQALANSVSGENWIPGS